MALVNINDQFEEHQLIQYQASFLLAIAMLLMVLTVYKMTVVRFHPTMKLNKLTFAPYKALLCFTFMVIVQTNLSIVYEPSKAGTKLTQVLAVVNLLKINFQNLTISLQTFEWLCYWNMINF